MFRSSFESVTDQLQSAPEQLRKCSGAVISLPEQLYVFRITYKCSGAVTKVFRSSYESVPEQLQKCSGTVISLP